MGGGRQQPPPDDAASSSTSSSSAAAAAGSTSSALPSASRIFDSSLAASSFSDILFPTQTPSSASLPEAITSDFASITIDPSPVPLSSTNAAQPPIPSPTEFIIRPPNPDTIYPPQVSGNGIPALLLLLLLLPFFIVIILLIVYRLIPRMAEDHVWLAWIVRKLRPKGKVAVTTVPLEGGVMTQMNLAGLEAGNDTAGGHSESTGFIQSRAPDFGEEGSLLLERIPVVDVYEREDDGASLLRPSCDTYGIRPYNHPISSHGAGSRRSACVSLESWDQHWAPSEGPTSPREVLVDRTEPGMWEIQPGCPSMLLTGNDDEDPFSDDFVLPPSIVSLADSPHPRSVVGSPVNPFSDPPQDWRRSSLRPPSLWTTDGGAEIPGSSVSAPTTSLPFSYHDQTRHYRQPGSSWSSILPATTQLPDNEPPRGRTRYRRRPMSLSSLRIPSSMRSSSPNRDERGRRMPLSAGGGGVVVVAVDQQEEGGSGLTSFKALYTADPPTFEEAMMWRDY